MRKSWKEARGVMLVIFAAATGSAACDSATGPEYGELTFVESAGATAVEEQLVGPALKEAAQREGNLIDDTPDVSRRIHKLAE